MNQDAKKVSKNKEEKMKEVAHIKRHSCDELGHLASGCPSKLEKKAQANKEKQGNDKHHMSKESKAQSKRKCYSCRERHYYTKSFAQHLQIGLEGRQAFKPPQLMLGLTETVIFINRGG